MGYNWLLQWLVLLGSSSLFLRLLSRSYTRRIYRPVSSCMQRLMDDSMNVMMAGFRV